MKEGKAWITSGSSYIFVSMVSEKQLLTDASPIAVMKAIKNDVETAGKKKKKKDSFVISIVIFCK